ncbi:hypothetical protein N7488_008068 [Penicillium malachiteum]|nr:hypothetical protein N7488_008068 [Penicillium malachiteum]
MSKQGIMALGPKPTKACVNCRRLKMKCEVSGNPPCRRCRHTRTPCVFKPRANASAIHDLLDEQHTSLLNTTSSLHDQQSILDRLGRIEAALGIGQGGLESSDIPQYLDRDEDNGNVPLEEAWRSVAHLRSITRPEQDESIWSRPVIKRLWTSFMDNLPLLHFLKDRDVFASPTPLLLASVLYISAIHHPSPEMGSLASAYFTANCCAIAGLVSPSPTAFLTLRTESNSEIEHSLPFKKHRKAFHNILGLIMASLSSEAYVDTTGSWIAMGYRMWLDHCAYESEDSRLDWPSLFSGLQVIDIEHASLHMSYPLLPTHPPTLDIQNIASYQRTAFEGLTEMMHFGLSHFVGRGLPTIWSSMNADISNSIPVVRSPFTEKDSHVIRLWARKLDDWLVQYNGASQPSPSDRQGILILLQYHLHKLYVLSIYHPARGLDLSSANISPVERHELLVSARAVLRLRQDDASIWSNWDLIMITWAAILLLRGVEDGMTHQDDLHLIQAHLQSLERSYQSAASIHTVLFQRLESSMQAMHTPPDTSSALAISGPETDDPWTIFDHEIMSLANPPWLFQDSTQLPQSSKSLSQVPVGIPADSYDSSLLGNSTQTFGSNTAWNGDE